MSNRVHIKHISIDNKSECCGCSSCYSICPVTAISMKEDDEGFQYPHVDEQKCVGCGLCVKKCPIIKGNSSKKTNYFYAVKHKHEEVRSVSSSGGIFSAMAQAIIDEGGVVYGAAYDEHFFVRHIRTNDQAWMRLRTAKYVQSDMGDVYGQVKSDIMQGKMVLFTGTPCQVGGLKLFLEGVDISKLITIDLICHGVPSPGIWKEYLMHIIEKYKKQIGNINFRNKVGCGWHNSTIKIESIDGTILLNESLNKNFFSRLFFSHLILRPCCYSCHYANLNRGGDMTIGDYWGVEKYHPELDDDKGISLIMVNTPKGEQFLKKILPNCQLVQIIEEECLQPNLKEPARDLGGRDIFWRTYRKYGLVYAGKRIGFLEKTFWDRIVIIWIKIVEKINFMLLK